MEATEITRPPTVDELLDRAKAAVGVTSDYKLALVLGIEPSTIGHYRKRRSRPDDDVAAKLADLAGLDRGFVVACLHADRAPTASARSLWMEVAARLSNNGSALALLLAVILSAFFGFDGGPDAGAALLSSVAISAENGLYIM
ncbi:DUF3693 domain-containing protein [Methylibium sp. Pch-M]|uniref:DUF3693 domain-containing protein n=1 Tax=Methylibium sp. Pch-M TaxID=2082386 RepID=UPI0010123A94|nr:DUF3693 domain-containing protein [Methylibium sp. Pch-M]